MGDCPLITKCKQIACKMAIFDLFLWWTIGQFSPKFFQKNGRNPGNCPHFSVHHTYIKVVKPRKVGQTDKNFSKNGRRMPTSPLCFLVTFYLSICTIEVIWTISTELSRTSMSTEFASDHSCLRRTFLISSFSSF